MEEYFR